MLAVKLAPTTAQIGVVWVVDWPCGQKFSVLSPTATDGAISATRREATVSDSDCGAGEFSTESCEMCDAESDPTRAQLNDQRRS